MCYAKFDTYSLDITHLVMCHAKFDTHATDILHMVTYAISLIHNHIHDMSYDISGYMTCQEDIRHK